MPVDAVRHAGIEAAAEQFARIGNHNWGGFDGAEHGPECPARRIVQDAADDVCELAGFLAELEEAPARRHQSFGMRTARINSSA